jgi:nucleotide-binding universal stress UspA family protein
MDHLLVATDLSGSADRALARAVLLARENGCRLTALHVLPPSGVGRRADRDAAERDVRTRLEATGAADAAVVISTGEAAAQIGRQAELLDADLIVIGAHGADGLVDLLRGATAERLSRAAPTPVLVVGDRPAAPYREVVVGADPTGVWKAAAESAFGLMEGGTVRLVQAFDLPFAGSRAEAVADAQRAAEAGLHEAASGLAAPPGVKVETAVRQGAVLTVLREEVGRTGADLLAVGTHGRTGVAHAFLGSVAEALLRDPPCDLLVARGGR